MAIGYEVSVTALQTASAFATIANDGIRVSPHVIKGIKQANGEIENTKSRPAQRVLSAESAGELRRMLRRVVESGTGKRARLNGYSSAGKTGTAWKYDPKKKAINRDKIVASFVGFAPMENPGVVIAIVIDEPQTKLRDGGHAAAPVFQEIAQEILPELEINPDPSLLRDTEIGVGDVEASIPSETVEGGSIGEQRIADRRAKSDEPDSSNTALTGSISAQRERSETSKSKSVVEVPVSEEKRERVVAKPVAKKIENKPAPTPESKPKSKTGDAKPIRVAAANLPKGTERLNRKT
jgi:membrane peptidoglycan carboxypeptidase